MEKLGASTFTSSCFKGSLVFVAKSLSALKLGSY